MARTSESLAPEHARALMGEIIGASVVIDQAPGLHRLPLEGTIVNETMGLLWVRPVGTERLVKVSKTGLRGTIWIEEKQLPLPGDLLRVRPEDRTKRLAPRGRAGYS